MTQSARSVLIFSSYLFIVGLELLFIPDFFTTTTQLPPAHEPYIRVVGALAFILGLYYYQSAKSDLVPFFKVSIPVRLFYFLCAVGLVVFKIAPPVFVVFGIIDLAGAIWTWLALKKEGKM